ncbi:hypothetical protein CANTEDRAFT_114836 [Yamadazyma tenuis ATCC 10573]|uniref:Uncharacterized protein n=1 Tax=Candida tenuis (strain ATCC 10573 / BCRC 21748 / CBS 615 / JCM 9827 / NBRC 10315 / NRRL Y-1498 / VKM Y-70) TaxID=590646 RepID=G3BA69_CANTC|nr:uncharacterized protein CANTEDRAFT_114836 [Yamadazyma tenuis ATCC 10573]EGV61372.1 hypothetical protein CANTEDRAFT_114836 [Yamadazyma tenuis ATCC 10573]
MRTSKSSNINAIEAQLLTHEKSTISGNNPTRTSSSFLDKGKKIQLPTLPASHFSAY